jgi:hypothetical protein
MLVLTGFAGKLHTDTLSGKERRYLTTELKASKAALINHMEGLSSKQVNFKPGKNKRSIRECMSRLASIEVNLWDIAKKSLQQEPLSLQKSSADDQSLAGIVQNAQDKMPCTDLKFKNIKEALKLYKNTRSDMLRYVKTSTENIRGHVAQTPLGSFDVYQLMLMNVICTDYYNKEIEKIKSAPNFPK